MENYPNPDDVIKAKGGAVLSELIEKNVPHERGESYENHAQRRADFIKEFIKQQEQGHGPLYVLDADTRRGAILWGEGAIKNIEPGQD